MEIYVNLVLNTTLKIGKIKKKSDINYFLSGNFKEFSHGSKYEDCFILKNLKNQAI